MVTFFALRHSVTILETSFAIHDNLINDLLILKLLKTNRLADDTIRQRIGSGVTNGLSDGLLVQYSSCGLNTKLKVSFSIHDLNN